MRLHKYTLTLSLWKLDNILISQATFHVGNVGTHRGYEDLYPKIVLYIEIHSDEDCREVLFHQWPSQLLGNVMYEDDMKGTVTETIACYARDQYCGASANEQQLCNG